MKHFYCTCHPDKKKTANGRTPYREVEADKDGICLDCGYYAVEFGRKIDPKGKEFRSLLFSEECDIINEEEI